MRVRNCSRYTWMIGLGAIALLSGAAAWPANGQPAEAFSPPGSNLALHQPYTFDPQPTYDYCTEPGDSVQLTDGEYVSGEVWTQPGSVGWSRQSLVTITIDMGRSVPVGGLSFSTAADGAGVGWPAALLSQIAKLEPNVEIFAGSSTPVENLLARVRGELQNFAEENMSRQEPLPPKQWRNIRAKHASLLGQLRAVSYIVWRRSPLKGLGRTQMPDELYPPCTIELVACGNEKEAGTFVVSNPASQTFEGRVELGDLQFTSVADEPAPDKQNLLKNGNEGNIVSSIFSSDCVTMHEVLYQDLRVGRTVADAIPEMDGARTLVIPPGESRGIWLNVDTSTLPPGKYTSNIRIIPTDTGQPAKSIPLMLEVLPVRLPEIMPIAVYNWDYAGDEHYVRDLVEHHNNTFRMHTGPGCMSFDEKGNATGSASWSSYDKMLQVKLRHARQQGGIIMFSYGIIRDFHRIMSSEHGWDFMSEPWKKAFKTWVLEFEHHMRDEIGMDYDEYAVQLWDEARGELAEMTIEAGEFMKSFAPKIRTCMDGSQSPDEVRAMDHVIDLWIPGQHTLLYGKEGAELQKIYAQIMKNGKPVWTYTCERDMKALAPLDYYRLNPWRVWKLRLQGTCFWAYNAWEGDPWNDFDGTRGDCGTIYSGAKGPVSSRRWEATRDGREDYKCLYLLRKTAENAGGDAAARTGAFIDSIVAEALAKPNDVDAFEKLRGKMLRVLKEQCGASLPKLTAGPEFDLADGTLGCRFTTDVQTDGRLFFRVAGNAEWRSVDFTQGTQHRAEIADLPEKRDVEWYLLFWDDRGATGFDITGLAPTGWFHTAGRG